MKRLLFTLIFGACLVVTSNADMVAQTAAVSVAPVILSPKGVAQPPVQDLGVIKINYNESTSLKRKIQFTQIEGDLTEKVDLDLNTASRKYSSFISAVSSSPDYRINKNFLSLTKTTYTRRKKSIMFVFVMNSPHRDSPGTSVTERSRTRIHVLWPGSSKKHPIEQKLIKNEYPVDVSVANYEDGYAQGEWNLVLPNKKPREVSVSFLWSF